MLPIDNLENDLNNINVRKLRICTVGNNADTGSREPGMIISTDPFAAIAGSVPIGRRKSTGSRSVRIENCYEYA